MIRTIFFTKFFSSSACQTVSTSTVSISQDSANRREIWSSSLCFLGCVVLVPSSALLGYPEDLLRLAAIVGFIVASLCLTLAATIDVYEARLAKEISSPDKKSATKGSEGSRFGLKSGPVHWVRRSTADPQPAPVCFRGCRERPRRVQIWVEERTSTPGTAEHRKPKDWLFWAFRDTLFKQEVGLYGALATASAARRTFTTKLYLFFGAVFFLVASTLYLPFWASQLIEGKTIAELGTWIFRFGSFAYLVANYRCASNVFNDVRHKKSWRKQDVINLFAICAFMFGSLFYITGGLMGQMNIGPASLMSILWVIGSVGFAIGSAIFLRDAIHKARRKVFTN